jgi:hypothetical protein
LRHITNQPNSRTYGFWRTFRINQLNFLIVRSRFLHPSALNFRFSENRNAKALFLAEVWMEKNTFFLNEHGRIRERWLWIGLLFLVMLLSACLAMISINAGPGWGPEGMKTHYRLEHIFTNVPDCLFGGPCPPRAKVPDIGYWVLWSTAEKQTPTGIETHWNIIFKIPLPW